MRKNVLCEVVGVRTIQITMHNGVEHTLTVVRYLSKLKNKHIFLETLNNTKCKYTTEGKVPNISRSAIIVMKGNKVNSHYHLLGGLL